MGLIRNRARFSLHDFFVYISRSNVQKLCENTVFEKMIVSLSVVEDSRFFTLQQIKQNPTTPFRMTFC